MKVKATVSFSGIITMRKDEVRECIENDTLKDLLSCGYVVEVKAEKTVKDNEIKRSNTRNSKK